MTRLHFLVRDNRAASAAEFGLILPLLLLLIFGIIDAGRFMWEYNQAEKATQAGARFAAATSMAVSGLYDHSFSISDGVPQGTAVPTDNFSDVTCTSSDCDDCTGSLCGSLSLDASAFTAIANRMAQINPAITAENVEITYRNVGVGFAGDPNGSDVSPLITVRLISMQFEPITTLLFGLTLPMPDFRASVTGEDLSGSISN